MRKFTFIWASILILLSPLSASSQTVSQDTSLIAQDTLKHTGQIDSLRMELEKVKKQAYEGVIESANRTISIATLVLALVALLVGVVGIVGYIRIRELRADYKETKEELRKSFERDLEDVRRIKTDIDQICEGIKEKGKFVDEETDNFKKRIKVLQKEVPWDFPKEISGLIEKDSKTAIEDYEKVMNKLFDEEIYFIMAYNYYVEKKYDESIGEFKKVIKLNPKRYDAYNNWSLSLMKLGSYEEAIDKLRKATKLEPHYAPAWYNIACVYSLQNKKKEALENLRKAIQLDPAFKEKAKKDEDFRNLWEDEDFKKLVE